VVAEQLCEAGAVEVYESGAELRAALDQRVLSGV
jgi:hypothetical protein